MTTSVQLPAVIIQFLPSEGKDTPFSGKSLFGKGKAFPSTKTKACCQRQVLPIALLPFVDSESGGEWFLRQLGEGRAVVLYCHGNQPSRATGHRVRLYKVLQGMNLHVVAFDYRGFADSTAVTLSEDGVVDDVIKMAAWVRSWSRSSLYVWGHSLGTGIATKAASQLCLSGDCPEALILQAPFTSIKDQLHAVSLTRPFRLLPWFDASFVAPLHRQGIEFASDRSIKDVTCPTLVLHAKDDVIVPYSLGVKLYEIARAHLGVKARLSSFEAYLRYGHNGICDAPQLPKIIRSFLRETSDRE